MSGENKNRLYDHIWILCFDSFCASRIIAYMYPLIHYKEMGPLHVQINI